MNLREERNFLDLPCVTVMKDLRRSGSSNSPNFGSNLRKRTATAAAAAMMVGGGVDA